jgi:hypothetical protein
MNCSVFVPTFLPMPEVLIAEYAHTHLPDCRGGLRPWQPWDTLLFLDKQGYSVVPRQTGTCWLVLIHSSSLKCENQPPWAKHVKSSCVT